MIKNANNSAKEYDDKFISNETTFKMVNYLVKWFYIIATMKAKIVMIIFEVNC